MNVRAIGLVVAAAAVGGGAVYLVMRDRSPRGPAAPPRAPAATSPDRGVRVPVGARAPARHVGPRDAGVEVATDAPLDAAPRVVPDVPIAPPPTPAAAAPATPLQVATADAVRSALAAQRAALADCWDGAPGRVAVRAIVDSAGRVTTLGFDEVPGRPAIRDCLQALDLRVELAAPGELVGVQLELELP